MAHYIVVSHEVINKEYDVDAGIDEFTNLVNEKLKEGYTCVGGVIKEGIMKTRVNNQYDEQTKMTYPNPYKVNCTEFFQALVRTAPQDVGGGERRQRKTLRKRK